MNKQCHCYEDVTLLPSIDPECISVGLLQLPGQICNINNGIVVKQNYLPRDAVFVLEVLYSCLNINQSTIFWDITPCSPLRVNRSGSACHLLSHWFLLAYFSTLKMEAICSFEMLVDIQRTTWCYIPEDGTLHNHSCENLRSYKYKPVLGLSLCTCTWLCLSCEFHLLYSYKQGLVCMCFYILCWWKW
jgi:hypothetical protein